MERITRKRKDRKLRRSRGVALAEAAIVMMVLCLVTLGALQYGWFFYCLHTITNAARQGARVAAVLDGTTADGLATLKGLLSSLPDNIEAAATATAVVTPTTDAQGHSCVKGQVVIPAASVALMPISFLPVPDCRATVIMAKEGGSS